MVRWSDLTTAEQRNFGNGCTFVPDFIFTANCRQHDFYYSRGGGLINKLQSDYWMAKFMWQDATVWWHYLVTVLYYLGLTILPFSYFFFRWGDYLDKDDILYRNTLSKIDLDLR